MWCKVPLIPVFPLLACAFYDWVRLLAVRYGRNIRWLFLRSKNAFDYRQSPRIQIFILPSSRTHSIFGTILSRLLSTIGQRGIFKVDIKAVRILFVFEQTVPIAFFKSCDDFLNLFLHHSLNNYKRIILSQIYNGYWIPKQAIVIIWYKTNRKRFQSNEKYLSLSLPIAVVNAKVKLEGPDW